MALGTLTHTVSLPPGPPWLPATTFLNLWATVQGGGVLGTPMDPTPFLSSEPHRASAALEVRLPHLRESQRPPQPVLLPKTSWGLTVGTHTQGSCGNCPEVWRGGEAFWSPQSNQETELSQETRRTAGATYPSHPSVYSESKNTRETCGSEVPCAPDHKTQTRRQSQRGSGSGC